MVDLGEQYICFCTNFGLSLLMVGRSQVLCTICYTTPFVWKSKYIHKRSHSHKYSFHRTTAIMIWSKQLDLYPTVNWNFKWCSAFANYYMSYYIILTVNSLRNFWKTNDIDIEFTKWINDRYLLFIASIYQCVNTFTLILYL